MKTRLLLMLMLCAIAAAPVTGMAQTGPDVIVGWIEELSAWHKNKPLVGISIGTWSCNIGDQPLSWKRETNEHPVIAQNMYRIENGRIEQIGLSWLKHGYYALSWNLCFNDCQATDGRTLGVHCADPYSSYVNGEVSVLGPRSQVNAATGEFPYPFTAPQGRLRDRRIMVRAADIDPDLHPTAVFLFEAQYVTADDAAAGNDDNNASYNLAQVIKRNGTRLNVKLATGEPTQRTRPAILAWADLDPLVTVTAVDIPDDGRVLVGGRAAELSDGRWSYAYAVQNLNSHRGVRAFEVPLSSEAVLDGVGFHDVEYRSGEGEDGGVYSGEDWPSIRDAGAVRWATSSYDENINANAIRWGTLYTFYFESDRPPQDGEVTLELFRPGTPSSISVNIVVPSL